MEKLAEVYQNKPSYADAEAQADTRQRLAHVSQGACIILEALLCGFVHKMLKAFMDSTNFVWFGIF